MRTLIRVLAIVVAPALVYAQPGAIRLSVSPAFEECEIAADAGPTVTIYVIHNYMTGARASQYRVSTCNSTLVYVSQTVFGASHIGTADSGIAVSYGACVSSPYVVQSIEYAVSGPLPLDSGLAVVADPGAVSGQIEGVDCNFASTLPEGSVMCVGCVSVRCQCVLGNPECSKPEYVCGGPTPVNESSWGKVKSLFR